MTQLINPKKETYFFKNRSKIKIYLFRTLRTTKIDIETWCSFSYFSDIQRVRWYANDRNSGKNRRMEFDFRWLQRFMIIFKTIKLLFSILNWFDFHHSKFLNIYETPPLNKFSMKHLFIFYFLIFSSKPFRFWRAIRW